MRAMFFVHVSRLTGRLMLQAGQAGTYDFSPRPVEAGPLRKMTSDARRRRLQGATTIRNLGWKTGPLIRPVRPFVKLCPPGVAPCSIFSIWAVTESHVCHAVASSVHPASHNNPTAARVIERYSSDVCGRSPRLSSPSPAPAARFGSTLLGNTLDEFVPRRPLKFEITASSAMFCRPASLKAPRPGFNGAGKPSRMKHLPHPARDPVRDDLVHHVVGNQGRPETMIALA